MLQLRIDQQYAKIGLDIQKPVLNLQTTLPAIELDIKEPELKVESKRPVIHIDQTQCFADAGKRKPADFAAYCAEMARNNVMVGIGRVVEEGNFLGEIENGGTIPQLAAASMDENIDYNVTAIPKQRPDIWFDLYPVNIEPDRGTVDLRLHRGKVDSNFQWGQVNAYLRQQNYININWEESRLNQVV
jgi:hypothetical protein